jgi:hypothetical protein
MANPKITSSVGKNAASPPLLDDVKTVQALLNGFVLSGELGEQNTLPLDGAVAPTIPYIEKFQKNVAGFNNPDGTVDPGGKTWQALIKPPRAATAAGLVALGLAHVNIILGPVGTIRADLWEAALNALILHRDHPDLSCPHALTLMDFRVGRKMPRLWLVNLALREVRANVHVAHGKGAHKKNRGDVPKDFGDSDYRTSLGAYVTYHPYRTSTVGDVDSPQPALKVKGLDRGVNGRARERGILFHAATYFNPPTNKFGSSWGCFATSVDVNNSLLPQIGPGSFVYAYAG